MAWDGPLPERRKWRLITSGRPPWRQRRLGEAAWAPPNDASDGGRKLGDLGRDLSRTPYERHTSPVPGRGSVAAAAAFSVFLAGCGGAVMKSTSTSRTTSNTSTTSTSTTQATSAVVPIRPTALAVGPNGNLYIADQGRNEILERLPHGSFVIVAGTGQAGYSGDGGPASEAQLDRPGGMAFGADGTLYFADEGNERVRAISSNSVITTVLGTGGPGTSRGFVSNGTPALDANVTPNDVALGPAEHLYVSTSEQVLRLDADGTLSVVVGADIPYAGVYGVGGPATAASADGADGIAFDSQGNLYIFGFNAKTILLVQPSGLLTEPMGDQSIYPHGDGGLATTPDGGVIAMGELSVVRLSPNGAQTIISFYPGLFHGIRGFSPNGIAIGPDGTIYVDTFYGNGFTDRSAIVSISSSGSSSQVLWEAPMGQ